MWRAPVFALSLLVSLNVLPQAFMPCAPYGGDEAVKWFIEQELRFPQTDLQEGVKGSSVLIFRVNANGELVDLRIWRPLTPACDAEALRIGKLVRWHPATVAGTPNDAEHYLEVPFDAKRYMKLQKERKCASLAPEPIEDELTLYEPKQVSTPPTPEIPNGMKGLPTYINAHLRYPEVAYKRDLQGTVRMEFVVERSGHVSNLRAIDALGGGCTEEALRQVREICWKPAEKDGKRVRCTQIVQIDFRLGIRDR